MIDNQVFFYILSGFLLALLSNFLFGGQDPRDFR